jgi:NADH dehydrogenase
VKVVITAANGAVGQAILRQEAREPAPSRTVVAAVRSDRAAKELPPLPNGRIARVSYDDPASLRAAFNGASAVIHLAGVLVEQPGSSYEQANVETTRRVAEAADNSGVEKLVYVSAVGADPASANRYWRTKGEAEALIRACRGSHTILRVPLLLGPKTEGAAALQRQVSRGTVVLAGGGRNLQQPLYVDDLARAVIRAADPGVAKNRTLDLVGPASLPDREILQRAARLRGRTVRIRSVPTGLVRSALKVRRRIAGTGFSADALDVITADTKLDPVPTATELGIRLTGIDEMIAHSLA